MKLSEFDLGQHGGHRVPSPGRCIYCGANGVQLTDEHVVPYALGANSLVLEKSSCATCQAIIQRYEQEVLKKQLGTFRAQVSAPTRRKKDRLTEVWMHFMEVDAQARPLRDLGHRVVPLDEAPLAICLWSSPMPRLLDPTASGGSLGQPWTWIDKHAVTDIARQVAKETGAEHVAAKIGEVNRIHYLRSLAKTAHAYATATIGLEAFEPLLPDLILGRRDDVETYVGDLPHENPFGADDHQTLQIAIGEATDGPAAGYLVVHIVLYPSLNSPAHVVILGRPLVDIERAVSAAALQPLE